MKPVQTWLNEDEYRRFSKLVDKLGTTDYSLAKNLIVKYLEQREKERNINLTVIFWFIVYSSIATVITFLF